jgi:hypothetical protein
MARRIAVVSAMAGLAGLLPSPALAHGIGGRSDLPVPVEFFVVGAGVVLVASFVLLAALWPKPRWQEPPAGRTIHGAWVAPVRWLLAALGVVGLAAVVAGGVFGEDTRTNAAPVLVWVYFWLVIPFTSAVVGDVWRDINPWRTIAGAADIGAEERPGVLVRWGVWPATVAFVAFTWLELVSADSAQPRRLAIAAIAYTLYVLVLVGFAGREAGMASGDAFTVYNSTLGRISPLGRNEDGEPVWRGWLRALPGMPVRPGTVVFVVALIGTVTYDGLSQTPWWRDQVDSLATKEWFGTLALVGAVAAVAGGYWVASWAAARLSGEAVTASDVARSFAHTLVPIALAYALAHYFTLVIFEGQLLIPALSDPLGRGWDLFGTADHRINFWLSANSIWYVQVAAIVGGHVAAVVLAHDRALAVFPPSRAVKTQYAMLGLMVVLTMVGLVLLASG